MKTSVAVLWLAGVFAMSGCNAEPAQEVVAPPEAVAPAPAAGGTPVVAADAMTADGWQKVRMGATLDELNAALGTSLTMDGNGEYAENNCTFLNVATAPGQPSVMYSNGKVVRLSLFAPGTTTYGGLQVGDKAAKVRDVFGADVVATPHKYEDAPAEYLTIWMKAPTSPDDPSARGVRFETGGDGMINAIHAGGTEIELVEGCS